MQGQIRYLKAKKQEYRLKIFYVKFCLFHQAHLKPEIKKSLQQLKGLIFFKKAVLIALFFRRFGHFTVFVHFLCRCHRNH